MDRVIFLSIDGVLNNNKTAMYDKYRKINKEMAAVLTQIINETGAKIILTDCRAYDKCSLNDFEYVKEYIEENIGPIYKVLCPVNGLENKGKNITQFLYRNYELNDEAVDYIILDNNYRDYDKYNCIYNHLFICDDSVGLNSASIDLYEYNKHCNGDAGTKYMDNKGYLSDFTSYVMSRLYPGLFETDKALA